MQKQQLLTLHRMLMASSGNRGEKPRGFRAARAYAQDKTAFKPFDSQRLGAGAAVGEMVSFAGGAKAGARAPRLAGDRRRRRI